MIQNDPVLGLIGEEQYRRQSIVSLNKDVCPDNISQSLTVFKRKRRNDLCMSYQSIISVSACLTGQVIMSECIVSASRDAVSPALKHRDVTPADALHCECFTEPAHE